MMRLVNLVLQVRSSPVLWAWIFNGVRMTTGIILLPLVLTQLPEAADMGMYYNFLQFAAWVPIIDFGFSPGVGRFISYAMAGAQKIEATGIQQATGSGPNYPLIWQLLYTTQRLYRWLSLIAFVIIGGIGTALVALCVNQTSNPAITWAAFGITVISAVMEIYFGWWVTFLQGMNDVLYSMRVAALGNVLKLIMAATFLLNGLGLLALPIAGFVASIFIREMARRRCLKLLAHSTPPLEHHTTDLLKTLWPNSWRLGVHLMSSTARNSAILFVCTLAYGLATNQALGLSIQIFAIIQGASAAWTQVKWPTIGQQLVRQDYAAIRKTLWPRLWFQLLTFALAATVIIPIASPFIHWIRPNKHVLPEPYLIMLAINAFLEMQFTFWTTLLTLENRLPYLWPTVITNVCTVVMSILLLKTTSLGLFALVVTPLVVGSLFNYWYWAIAGARAIRTNWWQFTFRPQTAGHSPNPN